MRGGGWFDGPMSYFRSFFSQTPPTQEVAEPLGTEPVVKQTEPEEVKPIQDVPPPAMGGKKTRRSKHKKMR